MRSVEPRIYLIAQTGVNQEIVDAWLKNMGAEDFKTNATTEAEKLVEHAGRRCYKSHVIGLNPNVKTKREDIGEYLDNILKSGHGSVMEHVTFTFMLENVSRVLTHELCRHRVGVAISQESMRFVRLTDIPFWMPTSIQEGEGPGRMGTPEMREKARKVIADTLEVIEKAYGNLEDIFGINDDNSPMKFAEKKKLTSMFRRIAPDGVATGIMWTANIRTLRTVFQQRCSSAAEEEIYLVFCQILDIMKGLEPNFFGDWSHTPEKGWTPRYPKV